MPRRARTAPRRAPRQKRGEETIEVLLQATELAIVRHGFHGSTTNRIAEIGGVSIGTLYHYFPTKESLVQAVVHRMWREEFEAMSDKMARLAGASLEATIFGLARARWSARSASGASSSGAGTRRPLTSATSRPAST